MEDKRGFYTWRSHCLERVKFKGCSSWIYTLLKTFYFVQTKGWVLFTHLQIFRLSSWKCFFFCYLTLQTRLHPTPVHSALQGLLKVPFMLQMQGHFCSYIHVAMTTIQKISFIYCMKYTHHQRHVVQKHLWKNVMVKN